MIMERRWLVVCASPRSDLDLAQVGWSDSDSNYEKENDVKTINTKRLSLSL